MSEPLLIPSELPEGFAPTPPQGLTDRQARRRKSNETKAERGKSVWQIIAGHLFTLFNLLNLLMAVALILVGSYRNFMGVVISNALIGTVQAVLFEEADGEYFTGHAPNYVRVYAPGRELHNELRNVRITGLFRDGLLGEILES